MESNGCHTPKKQQIYGASITRARDFALGASRAVSRGPVAMTCRTDATHSSERAHDHVLQPTCCCFKMAKEHTSISQHPESMVLPVLEIPTATKASGCRSQNLHEQFFDQ